LNRNLFWLSNDKNKFEIQVNINFKILMLSKFRLKSSSQDQLRSSSFCSAYVSYYLLVWFVNHQFTSVKLFINSVPGNVLRIVNSRRNSPKRTSVLRCGTVMRKSTSKLNEVDLIKTINNNNNNNNYNNKQWKQINYNSRLVKKSAQ